jgi:hypothetical protein
MMRAYVAGLEPTGTGLVVMSTSKGEKSAGWAQQHHMMRQSMFVKSSGWRNAQPMRCTEHNTSGYVSSATNQLVTALGAGCTDAHVDEGIAVCRLVRTFCNTLPDVLDVYQFITAEMTIKQHRVHKVRCQCVRLQLQPTKAPEV